MPMVWRGALLLFSIASAVRFKQTVDVRRPVLIRREVEVSQLPPSAVFRFGLPYLCDSQPLDQTDKVSDPFRSQIRIVYSDNARREAIRHDFLIPDLCLDVSEVVENGVYGPVTFGDIIAPTKSVLGHRENQRAYFTWCEAVLTDTARGAVNVSTQYRFRSTAKRSPERPASVPMSNFIDDFWEPRNASSVILPLQLSRIVRKGDDGGLEYRVTDTEAVHILSTCAAVSFRHHEAIPSYRFVEREFYIPAWTREIRVNEQYELLNKAARLWSDYRPSEIHGLMGRSVGTRRRHDVDGRGTPLLWTVNAEFPTGTRNIEYFDEIGNISTSQVLTLATDHIGVELEPRYPLLGGWKAKWQLRYHVPTGVMVAKNGVNQEIKVTNAPAIRMPWVWESVVRVILPPGSQIKDVNVGVLPLKSQELWYERQWMDVWPTRPVIQLRFGPMPHLNQNHSELKITFVSRTAVKTILHLVWAATIAAILLSAIWVPWAWSGVSRFVAFLGVKEEKSD